MSDEISWEWLRCHLDQSLRACDGSAARLLHGRSGAFPGMEKVIIDAYRPLIMIICFGEIPEQMVSQLTQILRELAKKHRFASDQELSILLQSRQSGATQWHSLVGTMPDKHIATYLGLQFELQLGQKQNVGLFMDMAQGHQLIREMAPGKTILNLFAYTCAFSVVALQAGASRVVNVDMSKAALAQGRRNHRLNQIDTRNAVFLGHNVMKSMSAFRKHGPYDVVICDPPTYQPPSFEAARDYPKLIRRLPQLLRPGGQIVACLNAPTMTRSQFLSWFESPPYHWVQTLGRPKTFGEPDPDRDLKISHFRLSSMD